MRSAAPAFSALVLLSGLSLNVLASTDKPASPLEADTSLPGQDVLESQATPAQAASGGDPVLQVPPGSVVCNTTITFTGQGEPFPGTSYDDILVSGVGLFAERFVGQTRTTAGFFDVLNDVANNPLTLQVGDPGQNINVLEVAPDFGDVVNGLGPVGFPKRKAVAEGSVAMLFPCGQVELRLAVIGGDGGQVTVQFFRRDGSHIGNAVINTPGQTVHGFRRAGNIADILGVSIYNNDPGGLLYDNICLTSCVTPVESDTWGKIKARYSQ